MRSGRFMKNEPGTGNRGHETEKEGGKMTAPIDSAKEYLHTQFAIDLLREAIKKARRGNLEAASFVGELGPFFIADLGFEISQDKLINWLGGNEHETR